MSSSQRLKAFVGTVLFAASSASVAAPDPQEIEMSMGKLIPTLGVTVKHDDNIFSQDDKTFKAESSAITQLEPAIKFLMETDGYDIAFTYTGDYGFYHSSSDDSYDDHTFAFDGLFSPTDLYSIDAGVSFAKLHDNRGEGSAEGILVGTRSEPDTYDKNDIDFLIDFGRETAKYGIQAGAGFTEIDYTNNRAATKFRDRRETSAVGRFYGRASGKTTYFVQYDYKEFSYSELTLVLQNSLDSVENKVSVGAEWDITGKTTGTASIGRLDKDFDDPSLKDDDLTVWDVQIAWAAKTYSTVYFSVSKEAQETNGIGSYIEAQNINVNWVHSWSDRVSTDLGFGLGDDEFPGSAIKRQDDRTSYSLAVNYDWKRWMTVGAAYNYTDRDSSINVFDFEKNVFLINFDMSL